MSKNMTQKGLAFGASIALGAGLLAGTPAFAAGTMDDSVTLEPTVGAEYTVRTNDVFDLAANYDASLTAANRFLKFLVADTAAKTLADIDNNGGTGDADLTQLATSSYRFLSATSAQIVTTTAHGLAVGDVVDVVTHTTGTAADGAGKVVSEIVDTTTFKITVSGATPAAIQSGTGTVDAQVTADGLNTRAQIDARKLGSVNIVGGSFPVSARSAVDNSYVVTGIANSVANDQVLRLISTDTTQTVSVNVTAWIDNNGNGEIDATEKVSPTRTVTFAHSDDITATTTIRPATAGETTVVADVVTSPVLNGLMVIAAANENKTVSTITSGVAYAKFTRQGDATEVASITNGAYSNTTKKFTFTSADFNDAGWTSTAATKVTPGTSAATTTDVVVYKVAVASKVVTVTTGKYDGAAWAVAAHGLRVGDTVTVLDTESGAAPTWETATAVKITSVPTTSSFTYAMAAATDLAAEVQGVTANTDTLYTVEAYLRDKVEAGSLTAQFFLDVTGAATATKVGAAGTYSVGAKVVGSAGLTLAGSPSATVNAAGKVAKGSTTASFVVSIEDADGDAVGAGVDVTLTAKRAAGASTITANGLAVGSATATTFYAKTDAAGTVTIALTNSVGAVNDQVDLTADSQGATQATISAIWEDKIYTIHDLADANYNNSVRSRSVASGASYTMNFLVQDQWKSPAGADVRLKVTLGNRSVQTSIVELTNGQGSFVVTDGGLVASGDTTVQVEGQKKSAVTGLWADTDASFIDWDGSGSPDLATVAIKYQAQSAIVLNANGANFPSTTAADLTADVTLLTPVALDGRISNAAAPAFTAATKAVVSGSVTLANGVTAPGSTVTVSGAGLAFKAGNIWALDTVTFATDGTFAVEVYSRTSGAKTVTVTSGAATKTATVTFAAIASAKGYSVALTAPDTVQRGSTMKVEGQVLDANGNGIPVLTAGTGAAATLQVSYLGLGLVSGVMPTTTDKDGKFYFYVLVGSNDVGTATVTASYDADGTGTTSAAVTVSKTIYVGQAAPSASKVNAGSFKGYVALYAKGYAGKRMSAKVGKDWVVVPALASDFERVVEFTGAGVDVAVRIYIDRVLMDTINLTTK